MVELKMFTVISNLTIFNVQFKIMKLENNVFITIPTNNIINIIQVTAGVRNCIKKIKVRFRFKIFLIYYRTIMHNYYTIMRHDFDNFVVPYDINYDEIHHGVELVPRQKKLDLPNLT